MNLSSPIKRLPIMVMLGDYNAEYVGLHSLDYNPYYDAFAAGGYYGTSPLLMLYTRAAPFQRVVWVNQFKLFNDTVNTITKVDSLTFQHTEFKIGVAIRGSLATDVNVNTFYFYAFVSFDGSIIASTRVLSFLTPKERKQFISTTNSGSMLVATRDQNNRGSIACLDPTLQSILWQKKFIDAHTWVTALLQDPSTGSVILGARMHEPIGALSYNKIIVTRVDQDLGNKINTAMIPLDLGDAANEVIIAKMRIRSNIMVGCLMNERLLDLYSQVGYLAYDFNLNITGSMIYSVMGGADEYYECVEIKYPPTGNISFYYSYKYTSQNRGLFYFHVDPTNDMFNVNKVAQKSYTEQVFTLDDPFSIMINDGFYVQSLNAIFYAGFIQNTYNSNYRAGAFFNFKNPFSSNYHVIPLTMPTVILVLMVNLIYQFDYIELEDIIQSTDVVLIPAQMRIDNHLQNNIQQLWPGTTSTQLVGDISYTFTRTVQPRETCYVNHPCTLNIGNFMFGNCFETNITIAQKFISNNSVVNTLNSIYSTYHNVTYPYTGLQFSYTPATAMDVRDLVIDVQIGYQYYDVLMKFANLSFELEILQFCEEFYQMLTIPTIQNLTYQLGSIKQQFLVGSLTWQYQQTHCPFTVTFIIDYEKPIATFNQITESFEVFTNDSSHLGINKVSITWTFKINYSIEINETLDWFVNVLAPLDQYSIKNTAPKFVSELKDQEVKAGESLIVFLPQVLDIENDNWVIVLDAGDAIIFSSIKNSQILINPDIVSLDKQYKINVIVQDTNQSPLQSKYSFKLKIIAQAQQNDNLVIYNQEVNNIAKKNKITWYCKIYKRQNNKNNSYWHCLYKVF
eukprot:403347856